MSKNFFQLGESGWWILVIALLSFAFAFWLYSNKKAPWNSAQNKLLAAFRFLAVFMLMLLLLDPSVRKVVNTTEPPIIALAIDNSQSSVASVTDSVLLKSEIGRIRNELSQNQIEVKTYFLEKNDTLRFDKRASDLSKMLKRIRENERGKNHAATILFSDGIFNRGSSPSYQAYLAPIFSVGLGDTIPPRDIKISRVLYNKVTYKGNESPIRVEINQKGYTGQTIKIDLSEKGRLIEQKEVRLSSSVEEIEFLLKTEEVGLRHLQVSTPIIESESINENNRSDLFLEVIDGRQKILIVAAAPHPDVKAIRSTLEATDNYQTELYIPAINDEKPTEIYDVVIFHGAFTSGINFLLKEDPGIWYILSNESSLTSSNKNLPFLNIQRKGSQPDKVSGSFNQNFSKFKIENTTAFEDFPPIEVPFGDYSLSGPTEVLMYQKLGNITTKKPLMAFYDDGSQKKAVLMGQNIWKWKLQESAINDDAIQFQSFITKTVQFLSVKNDKKQFQFKPNSTVFLDSEPVIFNSEVYNDIYERVYGNTIGLTLSDENVNVKKYDFIDSEFKSSFKVPSLESGIYTYIARTKVGEKNFEDRGEFLIENVNPELINLTADHRLLKVLSNKSGGEYLHFSESDKLVDIIKSQDFKSIIRSSESSFPLQKNLWWFLIIFLLFSTEWVLRKYWGGY